MDTDERSWETIAADSVLMNAVSSWRKDPEKWLENSIDRLNETVRVNPLRDDIEWVENWLQEIGAIKIEWFAGVGSAWTLPFPRGKAEGDVKIILAARIFECQVILSAASQSQLLPKVCAIAVSRRQTLKRRP